MREIPNHMAWRARLGRRIRSGDFSRLAVLFSCYEAKYRHGSFNQLDMTRRQNTKGQAMSAPHWRKRHLRATPAVYLSFLSHTSSTQSCTHGSCAWQNIPNILYVVKPSPRTATMAMSVRLLTYSGFVSIRSFCIRDLLVPPASIAEIIGTDGSHFCPIVFVFILAISCY